ncbi:MAG: protease inhibitor I42 family protein [Methanoregula sp.]|nr:protease inhibitor I42 family protein [Methanoregula sp.]
MHLHTIPGRRAWIVLGLVSLITLAFLVCGCTQPVQPVPSGTTPALTTPVPSSGTTSPATPAVTLSEGKKMVTFTEKDAGTTPEIAAGSRFAIQLAENPTTGYRWNASTTAGLEILSTDYVGNAHPEGMTGVGGIRTWVLRTTEPGDPSFTAVYQRPWEHATGNETAFKLTLHAVPV